MLYEHPSYLRIHYVCVDEESASVYPYRAAILHHAVSEAAVALSSDLHVVGALQQHGLLQVARRSVHVGHAVLTVVGEVLRSLGGQQSQEGHLNGGGVGCQAVITIVELRWVTGKEDKARTTVSIYVILADV